ncbi:GNAT family N-acetyltransferase [Mobilicoccus pelagius]|nr:N-acetyltransferase [Mobilicoccus pelagius]
MPGFAEYALDAPPLGPLPVEVDPLMTADVEPCARLAADREGDDAGRWREVFARATSDPGQLVLVARHRGRVAGYGKATLLNMEGARNAPPGWYLTGVVVDPPFRRRGVGERLTRTRLDELRRRGVPDVRYFANARNLASLRLHERLGFREVTRDFSVPGVTFTGGVGVLCRWTAA